MKKGIGAILLMISLVIILYLFNYEDQANVSPSKEEEVIVLTVLAGQSTTDAGIEDMIDEALAVKFPKVKLEWECVDWGEKFNVQMQARFASGDIPDLIIGKAQDVMAYSSSGNLSPIPEDCVQRIEEQALPAVSIDGIVYGIPLNFIYQGIIYNKSMFGKYGIDVPTTLEELDEVVAAFTKKGITPFATHLSQSWQIGNMTMQFLTNDLFNITPNWGDDFRKEKTSFKDNEVIKHCMLQNKYIFDNSWTDALYIDQYECDKRFMEGEAAMYLTGTWSLQAANNQKEKELYGIFPYPNLTGDAKLIRETNITFMKSSTNKNSELVDEILEELMGNDQLIKEILDFTQTYSSIKDVKPEFSYSIDEDVKEYEEKQQVVEVTNGNNQLIWNYQNNVALKQQEWLQGQITLEEVLEYADHRRQESSNR